MNSGGWPKATYSSTSWPDASTVSVTGCGWKRLDQDAESRPDRVRHLARGTSRIADHLHLDPQALRAGRADGRFQFGQQAPGVGRPVGQGTPEHRGVPGAPPPHLVVSRIQRAVGDAAQ